MSLANVDQKITFLEEQNSLLSSQNTLLQNHLKSATQDLESAMTSNKDLHAANSTLKIEVDHLKQLVLLMKQAVFGKKTEKTVYNAAQMNLLFNEAESNADIPITEDNKDDNDADTEKTVITKKPGGRRSLPKTLPREIVIHELPPSELQCSCGGTLSRIGEEISEELHYIPAKVLVKEHVRYKYACKCCEENVKRAPAAFRALDKSIASSGLLADMLVKKYSDHLPLYRQSEIWNRQEIDLSRATLSNWVIGCAEKFELLVNLLKKEIIKSDYVCSDETPLNVLNEPKNTSYMWVHLSGLRKNRCVVYEYNKARSQEVVNQFLGDFKGYHQSDGYIGYSDLHSKDGVVGVGCMAHARRKFMDIIKISKSRGVAHEVVSIMNELYSLEKKIASLGYDEIKSKRNEKAKPILDKLYTLLKYYEGKAPPQGVLSKAIGYTLNQWDKLTAYLKDGRLRIDNNDIERAIKPFTIGRRNWLFSNTERGAKASSIIYSLIETCKANKINSYYYLKYILENIHRATNVEELRAMLPFNLDPAILKQAGRA